ncbi:hypothetical protein HMPREF9465_00149 [Sutterella wadsworthensis 2_1_59BFAA]|uniref:Uncharacterized protein n=1 Tax=Sutterella wadsworthensis 2_1_59BFAA TaxID=742823 RepID=K1KKB6_9BURK|nr:hypothetical protein [Sutterella wadsworthensis]EKB32134.1 hypothetical protein HMPREF9465_00149 [Sutterella wadsworthensis 2_1_59BFAA]
MIVIETASFDIQKIKNTTVEGTDYQQGDLLGFWNVLEYVIFRDGRERQKFCVHGIIGARQSGASNEHEYQTQFS